MEKAQGMISQDKDGCLKGSKCCRFGDLPGTSRRPTHPGKRCLAAGCAFWEALGGKDIIGIDVKVRTTLQMFFG